MTSRARTTIHSSAAIDVNTGCIIGISCISSATGAHVASARSSYVSASSSCTTVYSIATILRTDGGDDKRQCERSSGLAATSTLPS